MFFFFFRKNLIVIAILFTTALRGLKILYKLS